ncbi:PTS transporter subunit EIIC [Actinomadura rudentiformis]|uniref:PTS sugar transporter subunit IIA n=1 Tax=Actinomadura rudentiformis TaxID=359158 RepID=A0A6H9ZAY3_9ACTN|nr:PTS transporter subunit EIIC [Actinomadura rudentiformis]KAB2351492.1 PTS sugar transporter subunit IIA [Actinomadura rudentiformis]
MSSTAATTGGGAHGAWSATFAVLQRIGRSLMLPIAVLPAAGILLRLGQDDLLGKDGLGLSRIAEVFAAAGGALLDNLAMLFAVGVAIGFARKADGSTALSAVVAYLVFDRVTKVMFAHTETLKANVVQTVTQDGAAREVINYGAKNPTQVLGGIVVGLMVAVLYQRFYRIKLPTWLAFFGGRRFVPIISAGAALLLGVVFGFIWPTLGGWIDDFGDWITGLGAAGAGVYGMANRLLLPFGLHHILNTLVWFTFGSYRAPDGVLSHGEINRYLAGDPDAGTFLAGFFPVLMLGLPGAAAAIWMAAPKHKRSAVGGLMVSAGLTAFVCGVTEPIEFSFMFVAPLLYVVHVLLTGVSMFLLAAIDAQLGFSFSAGLIDMLLNATKSNTRHLWAIIGLGVIYFFLYFAIFYFAITKFNLPTPGREREEAAADGTMGGLIDQPTDTPAAEPGAPRQRPD